MTDHQHLRERAVGALVGLAVGDALGTTLEFCAPGTFEPIADMVGGGPFGLPAGTWTDDTSLAMCLAESILDTGRLDPGDQLRRYVAWWREGYWSASGHCFDIGDTTRRALDRFVRTGEVTDLRPDENRAANGSLMRLAPAVIRWFPDIAEAAQRAVESSRTTHAASRAVDACRAMGAMIAALIHGHSVEDAFRLAAEHGTPCHPELEAVLHGSWRERNPPDIRGSGYAVAALEAAMWAVDGAADFRDAVLRADNLGDDADTTGAIAGQLAGARWGVESIPVEWRRRIAERERIEAIANRLFEQAVGADPTPEWGFEETVHGYWVEPGAVIAGEFPGHVDVSRARRTLNLLVDHGVRTFVDLTAPSDPLPPYAELLDEISRRRALSVRRVARPIPDFGVLDDDGYTQLVRLIRDASRHGAVYVHCWGGVGRTGTVRRMPARRLRVHPHQALRRIADLRSTTSKAHARSPETPEQIDVVRRRSGRCPR